MPGSIILPVLGLVAELSGKLALADAENQYLREEVHRLERQVLATSAGRPMGDAGEGIRTRAEMRRVERDNLRRALEGCGWRVSGPRGAAARLGMKPTTLASRIKALGLTRRPHAAATSGIPEF